MDKHTLTLTLGELWTELPAPCGPSIVRTKWGSHTSCSYQFQVASNNRSQIEREKLMIQTPLALVTISLFEVGEEVDTPEPPEHEPEQGAVPNINDKSARLRRSLERLDRVHDRVRQTLAWLETELRLLSQKPTQSQSGTRRRSRRRKMLRQRIRGISFNPRTKANRKVQVHFENKGLTKASEESAPEKG